MAGGKWRSVFLAAALAAALIVPGCGSDDGATKVGTVSDETDGSEEDDAGTSEEADVPEDADTSNDVADTEAEAEETAGFQDAYYVGDILQDGDIYIVYMASGVYTGYSDYGAPEEGYQYIYLQFYFENTGDSSDQSVSYYSFDCYADGYAMDMYYSGEEDLSATLSPGRSTTGYIYFTIPEDALEVEVEYTANYFSDEKITFVYQGEEDSGYVPESDASASEDAFTVGDIIETDSLLITYVSCENDTSYESYWAPAEGYHYVTCTFEFENTGDDDEFVSYFDFDCYADGASCEQSYFRDDALSATISSGRKAEGTVTFEVPDGASVVEFEYETNYWTSSRVVFECVY